MKIGIIGMGFVGENTAKVLGDKHDILPFDKFKDGYTDASVLKDAEVIFVAVPTPMKPTGQIDYSIIYDALDTVEKVCENDVVVVIRSTVVPGSTAHLNEKYPFEVVSNPEFLKERTAYEDMKNTDRVVIGTSSEIAYNKVKACYEALFPGIIYVHVDSSTAEMVKYTANVTLAGQVMIANEIYGICQKLGIDYNKVKEVTSLDKRLGTNRDVPGPDGSLGFGGKCFPKDLHALIFRAQEVGHPAYLLREVWRSNERIRENKDWLTIKGATSENTHDTKE